MIQFTNCNTTSTAFTASLAEYLNTGLHNVFNKILTTKEQTKHTNEYVYLSLYSATSVKNSTCTTAVSATENRLSYIDLPHCRQPLLNSTFDVSFSDRMNSRSQYIRISIRPIAVCSVVNLYFSLSIPCSNSQAHRK